MFLQECSTNYIRDESGSCVPNFAIRECPNGLIGENCDQCPEGFVKYDDGCTQYPTVICDRAGTQSKNVNGSCNCKVNIGYFLFTSSSPKTLKTSLNILQQTGCELADCSGCKPGYFYLSEENPETVKSDIAQFKSEFQTVRYAIEEGPAYSEQ